jgi:hypothetical protein
MTFTTRANLLGSNKVFPGGLGLDVESGVAAYYDFQSRLQQSLSNESVLVCEPLPHGSPPATASR